MKRKRLFSLLAMMLIIATSTWAATDKSFTITFKSSTGTSDSSSKVYLVEAIVDEGASYVYSVEADNVYNGKSGYGIKLGTSSKAGSLTLTLSEEVKNVTSIVVNARQYSTASTDQTLKIQGDSYTTTEEFADYTYTYSTPASVTSIALATATKRTYIKSVTVNYTEEEQGGGSTGGDTKYAVALAEGTVDAANWAIAPAEAAEGAKVTATYSGSKHVKSVTAIVKVPAEGHALSASAVGEIVGSDGKAYAAVDKENLPRGVTAVALVCYKNGSNGLALALADESSQMSWDSAITTCAAKTPTITGGTWKLASQDEWNQMINAVGGYAALRDGFSTVGGDNLKSNEYYWSSTQEDSISGKDYSFTSGKWGWAGKDTQECVRACLAF